MLSWSCCPYNKIIIIAFFEIISETVQDVRIELHGGWDYCGGDNVQIHLIQGARECKTNVVYDPYLGQAYWFELGTCKGTTFHVDNPTMNFKIITTTGGDFCPKFVTIYMNGGAQFWSSELNHWHDKKNNDDLFTANKKV
jgi:hypothetical protein